MPITDQRGTRATERDREHDNVYFCNLRVHGSCCCLQIMPKLAVLGALQPDPAQLAIMPASNNNRRSCAWSRCGGLSGVLGNFLSHGSNRRHRSKRCDPIDDASSDSRYSCRWSWSRPVALGRSRAPSGPPWRANALSGGRLGKRGRDSAHKEQPQATQTCGGPSPVTPPAPRFGAPR